MVSGNNVVGYASKVTWSNGGDVVCQRKKFIDLCASKWMLHKMTEHSSNNQDILIVNSDD